MTTGKFEEQETKGEDARQYDTMAWWSTDIRNIWHYGRQYFTITWQGQ